MLRWLRRTKVETFGVRDCFEATKGRLRTMKRLTPALELLEDHGYVRPIAPGPKTGPGRPRSAQFRVNPHVFEF